MALRCLSGFCCCIWGCVQGPLQGFLGTVANAFLSPLGDRASEEVTVRTALWMNRTQLLPTSTDSVPSREALLNKIDGLLRGDNKGIIGLCGMGGVGKTTLLEEIHNQLVGSGDNPFDAVIWVTVSRDVNIFKIQEDIGVRLGFSRSTEEKGLKQPKAEPDRRNHLHRILSGKKCLLLLDDMWKELKLEAVGIPDPRSGNGKIVFTTRNQMVCVDMDAHPERVDCLNWTESWEFFCSKVGGGVDLNNDPVIRPLAESVAKKCGGVPLALKTVGHAMSGQTCPSGWDDAIRNLRESPSDIEGMEEHVLSILKYSFDRLQDDPAKECLKYCSLFLEDADIDVDKLIGLWIGEGFLDSSESGNHTKLYQARGKGRSIIKILKNACLLEDGGSACVRLHDLVRQMAVSLTIKTNKLIVLGGDQTRLGGSAEVEGSPDTERISIDVRANIADTEEISIDLGAYIDQLPCPKRECPKLITFLVRCNYSCRLSGLQNFMQSMQALRVLDLGHAELNELPSDIGLLVELRHLNLEWTFIEGLPKELGKLVKLRHLNLSNYFFLRDIPREALITLESLQSLDLFSSGYYMAWQGDGDGICLKDLESHLGRLEELSVNIFASQYCLQNLAHSEKLQRCPIKLGLHNGPELTVHNLSVALEKLKNLKYLTINNCESLNGEWEVNGQLQRLVVLGLSRLPGLTGFVGDLQRLQKLIIRNCSQLKDISLVGKLPCLEELELHDCHGMVELVQQPVGDEQGNRDPEGQHAFPKLRVMLLFGLPALTSIAKGTLLFPCLETLNVGACPELKKLPLGLDSGKNNLQIAGHQWWWDAL